MMGAAGGEGIRIDPDEDDSEAVAEDVSHLRDGSERDIGRLTDR